MWLAVYWPAGNAVYVGGVVMTDKSREASEGFNVWFKHMATTQEDLPSLHDAWQAGHQAAKAHTVEMLESEEMVEAVARGLADRDRADFPTATIMPSNEHYRIKATELIPILIKAIKEAI